MIEDKILLTARYVEGDMSDAERSVFEIQMQNDAVLQQHFKDYNDIHQSLKIKLAPDPADQLFRDTLTGFNEQYFKPQAKIVSLKPYIKLLSGIAAVLFIGLFIWAPWQANLYDRYAGDSKMAVTERGAEKETDLDRAAGFYNAKDYKKAKVLLQKLHLAEPENAMVTYYYGNTLMEEKEIEAGRKILNQLFEGESIFKYDAAYGIAMSYLKENNKVDCKIWLQKIPVGAAHYNQAQELNNKL